MPGVHRSNLGIKFPCRFGLARSQMLVNNPGVSGYRKRGVPSAFINFGQKAVGLDPPRIHLEEILQKLSRPAIFATGLILFDRGHDKAIRLFRAAGLE